VGTKLYSANATHNSLNSHNSLRLRNSITAWVAVLVLPQDLTIMILPPRPRLILQPACLRHASFENLGITFLPKCFNGLVIDGGCGFTSIFEVLILTLIKHVVSEVFVDAGFIGVGEAVLFLEVAIAEVVAIAGVDDYYGIRRGNQNKEAALCGCFGVSLQSKPNGLSGEDEHPSELQSNPAGPACALRLLMNWLIEMLKTKLSVVV
jgi:hypothetical protein